MKSDLYQRITDRIVPRLHPILGGNASLERARASQGLLTPSDLDSPAGLTPRGVTCAVLRSRCGANPSPLDTSTR
jgi:hypothetical protein